jgi:hypothetical protein
MLVFGQKRPSPSEEIKINGKWHSQAFSSHVSHLTKPNHSHDVTKLN